MRARLGVKRTGECVWAVRVLVEDGSWTAVEVGSHADALAIALEEIAQRRTVSAQVVEVP